MEARRVDDAAHAGVVKCGMIEVRAERERRLPRLRLRARPRDHDVGVLVFRDRKRGPVGGETAHDAERQILEVRRGRRFEQRAHETQRAPALSVVEYAVVFLRKRETLPHRDGCALVRHADDGDHDP